MSKPNYTEPPPHYQVMTVGEALMEHPEDVVFTPLYRNAFGVKDHHWCYVSWYRPLMKNPRKPMVIAITTMDEEYPGNFETYEEACRMAWYSHVLFEMLGCNMERRDIDRIVAKFQKDGTL